MECLDETLNGVGINERKELFHELKGGVIAQLKYLQSHLPYQNKLLKAVTFLDPNKREDANLQNLANSAALELKGRFTPAARARIIAQVAHYQSLSMELLPTQPDTFTGRVDHWWRDIFKIMEDQLVNNPQVS